MFAALTSWFADRSGLAPDGLCQSSQPGLILAHAGADLVIGLSCLLISAALGIVAWRRADLSFRPLFLLFTTFIALCGLTEWLDALTLFGPLQGWLAVVKSVSAAVSIGTAVAMWRCLRQGLSLPTPEQYRAATEALRKTQDFLERTGHAANVGGWELELEPIADLMDHRFVFSEETCEIHGREIGFSPTLSEAMAFYPPEVRPVVLHAAERSVADGTGFDLELPFDQAGGRRIWVRAIGKVMSEGGRPTRLAGALQDVTDTVVQRMALERANERIMLATESAGVGIWEWDVDRDALIWDPRMRAMHGLAPGAELTTLAAWRRVVHAEDAAAMDRWIHGTIDGHGPFDAEFRVVWPDGSLHHLRSGARVNFDPDGRVLRMVGVSWDVTEARALAADLYRQTVQLADSEAKYRLLAENAKDMIIWVGPEGERRYVSPAAESVLGVPPEVLEQRDLLAFVHPDDAASVSSLEAGLLRGQTDEGTARFRVLHPVRGEVWVETGARLLRSPDGRAPAGYISILRDVTDRVRVEEELRRANAALDRLADQAARAKIRFLAGMSHEMRTPLHGILGYARLLRMEGGLNQMQLGRVHAMLRSATHLLEMIHCVLDLSEVDSDRAELHQSEVDLPSIMQASLDIVRPDARAKGLELEFEQGADVPRTVTLDPTRLRQVLLNLLGNAVKYTGAGRVVLRAGTAEDRTRLRLEVADTGPGIPADQRHRLFKEFERLQPDAPGATPGWGLGLSLATRFALLMGGSLEYEDNPGGGSLFRLDLPLVAPPLIEAPTDAPSAATAGGAAAARPPEGTAPHAAASLPVLVVDDVAMNRDIASAFLAAAGYVVVCVDGGAEAVEAAASTDFQVVLMDVRMPEVDGLEATRRIRNLDGARGRVPIVALTAQVFAEQIDACRKAGMDSHLAKPFTMETLLAGMKQGIALAGAGFTTRAALGELSQSPDSQEPQTQETQTQGSQTQSPQSQGTQSQGSQASQGMVALSASAPPTRPPPGIGGHLPVLDAASLQRTASMLTPEAVQAYLTTLASSSQSLRRRIARQDALTGDAGGLAEAAHALAGSAGMFGFERLVFAARHFEQVLRTNPRAADSVAAGLGAAIEASLEEMGHLTNAAVGEG